MKKILEKIVDEKVGYATIRRCKENGRFYIGVVINAEKGKILLDRNHDYLTFENAALGINKHWKKYAGVYAK